MHTPTPLRAILFSLSALLLVPSAAHPQGHAPAPRIVTAIDENNLVPLKGNTHPLANPKNDRGRVSPALPMTNLVLLLSRSPEQQAAFDKFVANQYDPSSPDFHHWLQPAEVGEEFGPSQTDIQTLSNWLTSHGFSVGAVSRDRMSIQFDGTAGQVESAFHTEIHDLDVGGVPHIANFSDPQIPAAIAPAVAGITGLHNFFPKPMHRLGSKVKYNKEVGKWQRISVSDATLPATAGSIAKLTSRPEFTVNNPNSLVEDVAPYDFATIYNVLPLWNSNIDGTGQTIAIAGRSDINLSDVTTFRKTFGLPAYTASNQPKVVIVHGADPTCTSASNSCDDDLTENTLDVEWSGAVAKGAQIVLVVAGSNSSTDDTLLDAERYIVDNDVAPILSLSYGGCELFQGQGSNEQTNQLWQTAASEGIAVFVASGDSGSALCDDGSDQQNGTPWAAQYGLAVNGLASSQYDTAVGGTDFNWTTGASPYWGNTNNTTTGANALGYVPEIPWNDTCTNPLMLVPIQEEATAVNWTGVKVTDAETACNFLANDAIKVLQNQGEDIGFLVDTVGGGGGASNCYMNSTTTSLGACSSGYPKPSWQTTLTPADNVRDLPDVSFFASNGFLSSAYLICVSLNGACVTSTNITADPTAQEIGGTSVSTPAMAGVMALINQNAKSPQGNPNGNLYALAGKQNYSACSAESVTSGSTSCYFNDIDTGTISMPCDYGAADGGIVYENGTPTIIAQQAGIKSPNCNPTHSGDTVGILPGVNAKTGYDLATGLGSLNIANVVNGWAASTPTPAFDITGPTVSFVAGATTGNTSALSITPAGGFTGAVALSCVLTNPPGGIVAPTCSVTPSTTVTGTTAATATLTVNTTASTTAGAYTFTVTGTSTSPALTESGAISVTVTAPVNPNATFTLSAGAAAPASVNPGGTSVANITVSTTNGYAGTVALTCTPASTNPSNSAGDAPLCDVTTSGVAVGSSTPVSVLTIAAVSTELTWPHPAGQDRRWIGAGGGAVLALLFFFGIPARRRKWLSMLGTVLALVVLGSVAACGGGGGGGKTTTNPGTAAGTYVFTVNGTGTPTPASPATAVTFSVVVN